jgi:hypothetical protein
VALPPERPPVGDGRGELPGAFLFDADTTDEQIGRYAALCAADDSCRTRTDDLAATMRRTATDIPDHWLFLPIKDANVRVVSMLGLPELDSGGITDPRPDDARRLALRGRG